MIGVFDSGSGGLTILNALTQALPKQDFLYFGDHGNAPYGHRSNEQIVELTRRGVDTLMQRGCKLVILACNTAAAVALRQLQQEWLPTAYPDNRILGVLVPMVEAVTGVPWSEVANTPASQPAIENQSIALFATRKTVESNAFGEEVHKRSPHVSLMQKACPGLVDAIEGGAGPQPLQGLIQGYVDELDLTSVGAVILGCTHFPLVASLFQEALPDEISIFSQPTIVADATVQYLQRRPEFKSNGISRSEGTVSLITSGHPHTASSVGSKFLNRETVFRALDDGAKAHQA